MGRKHRKNKRKPEIYTDTGMSVEDALIIKDFRKNHTWRGVAREAAERWPDRNYCNGNQIEGMLLCCTAAKTLGEDPNKYPWN